MTEGPAKVLVIGYGNPGRCDDGLGPALAEALEQAPIPGVTVDSDYQLTVEHAAAVAEHDAVVFADAAVSGPEPFAFQEISPRWGESFTTHHVDPQAVLHLARSLFSSAARGHVLAVRGYAFNEFGETLSPQAQRNLAAALEFLRNLLQAGSGFRNRGCETEPLAGLGIAAGSEDQP